MNKRILKIMIVMISVVCLFALTGCNNSGNTEIVENTDYEENINVPDVVDEENALKAPTLKWAKLYNPNGFDTITLLFNNPNNVDIDTNFDLAFYKDNALVKTISNYYYVGLGPNDDGLVWGNYGLPKENEVDEIKLENVSVNKSNYSSISADYEVVSADSQKTRLQIKCKEEPTNNKTVWVVFYNDSNADEKLQKDEILVCSLLYLDENNQVEFENDVYSYTNYEVFYNLY